VKKYLSPFVCGFGAGVLQIVPVTKSLACCLVIPVAAYLSLLLEQKAQNSTEIISAKKGLVFGLMTGLYAAFFASILDIMVTFITKHNELVAMVPQLYELIGSFPIDEQLQKEILAFFQNVNYDITQYGFSALYTFSVVVNNLIVNPIFGMIGGVIGAQIINNKYFNKA
jgi:hypothetical protein